MTCWPCPFPAAYGGLEGDLLTVCLAIEQISRVCATSGLIVAIQELGALPLLLAGNPEQHARWFPDLAAGRMLPAFALTEAEAGSDAASLRTRARREGDGWRIDGAKRFITQGNVAKLVNVFALTDETPEARRAHRHLSCFIVEQGMPGFSAPQARAQDGHPRLAHGRADLRGRPGARRQPRR